MTVFYTDMTCVFATEHSFGNILHKGPQTGIGVMFVGLFVNPCVSTTDCANGQFLKDFYAAYKLGISRGPNRCAFSMWFVVQDVSCERRGRQTTFFK